MRDHLEGMIARAKGDRRDKLLLKLAGPPLPSGAECIWSWFCDLAAGRGGGFGPAAISWMEVAAWQTLRRTQLADWELDLIRALDNAYLRIAGGGERE